MVAGACLRCGARVNYWRTDTDAQVIVDDEHPDGTVILVKVPKPRWTEYRAHVLEDGEHTDQRRYRLHPCFLERAS